MKRPKYHQYETFENQENFTSYSKKMIAFAEEQGIMIENNPEKVGERLKSDIKETLPAQLFALLGEMIAAVENIEVEDES